MRAFLHVLVLRWLRSRVGVTAFAGALFAPLAFGIAITVLVSSRFRQVATAFDMSLPAPGDLMEQRALIFSAVMIFAAVSSALAASYSMIHAIHIDKQLNRSTLLRASGFSSVRAATAFLIAGSMLSLVLVPASLLGSLVVSSTVGAPVVRLSFSLGLIAMVTALSPIVILSRMLLAHPSASTIAHCSSFFGASLFVGLMAPHYDPSLIDFAAVGALWFLGAGAVLSIMAIDARTKRRAWA